jgi:large subunit ribosomal protein L19
MELIQQIEQQYRKPALPQVQSGDTVRVHQLIKEGNKQRIQVFEGVVIRRHRMNELTACITVRRIASGVGVEKTFLLHSPNVAKVEILRRAKVRRNFLSYLRERRGKSARLKEVTFDKVAANDVSVPTAAEEEQLDEEITEIDTAFSQDALDQAVPLDVETKAEGKAAASQDEVKSTEESAEVSEQTAAGDEFAEGVERAETEDKQ